MAFLDRVRGFFRRIIGAPEEPPLPPPPPPREPPDSGGTGGEDPHDERMRNTFIYITGNESYGDYTDWRDLFEDTGVLSVEDNPREIERLFNVFLRSHYLLSGDEGSVPRSDYYADSGLGRDRVDWQRFREIKKT